MLILLLCAQVASSVVTADSVYSTPALRDMIAAAAVANRRPPPAFRSYTSRIESELSLLLRDTLGREHTAQVEEFATTGSWTRAGNYDLHVVGYRSQSVGVPYSVLSIVRAWTVPSLYGDRLSFGAYFNQTRDRGDTLFGVHPFARDRDRYYQFSGGDTVTVLRIGARSVPIARIHVRPRIRGPTNLGAFDGEIDLDAERSQIVRMRGQFVTVGSPTTKVQRVMQTVTGLVAAAYVEFVNAEVDGKYWLPAFQRTEFQASFPIFGQTRPIFRIVSTIRDIVVNDSPATTTVADSSHPLRIGVTWAPSDSVSRYGAWEHGLGSLSASVHSDDFQDVAPDAWRADGPPRLTLFPNNMARVVRFNRVEGVFTGVAPSIDFRSVAPGLTAGADVGWAWTEQTARGGGFVNYHVGLSTYGVRAERTLAATDNFRPPLSEEPGFAALLSSIDNYDYVDRRAAMASLSRVFGSLDVGLATLQVGIAADQSERARLTHGLFSGLTFLPNRGAANGHYGIGIVDVELHPNVTGDFVQPGVGLRTHYEIGSGELNWQRVEVGLSGRYYLGPVALVAHADAGIVGERNPPPQRLFTLGGDASLPGYGFDAFTGDHAALFRTFASYRFKLWERPIHVLRNFFAPGVSPGLAVSAQGGWTTLSPATAASLGPLAQVTNGVRATVGGGLTLFSDIFHVGVARPVDHAAPWKFVAGFGAEF